MSEGNKANTIPTFHDGYLNGIILNDNIVTLHIRRVDGDDYEVRMSEVEHLRLDDFRQGNIILDLKVWSGRQFSQYADITKLYEPYHPSADQKYHDQYTILLNKITVEVERGEKSFVVITPSYGAELYALCKTIEYKRIVVL
ncbi:MAG: hypothetical protein ABF856_16870 [Acetobacter aceti]|uniref:hypothetical protein n=1 Tax=Acetobacter aceti TaxID=435 RepID=UPI0011EA56BB|nr:hypothetical protein [Acetobacter aceti]